MPPIMRAPANPHNLRNMGFCRILPAKIGVEASLGRTIVVRRASSPRESASTRVRQSARARSVGRRAGAPPACPLPHTQPARPLPAERARFLPPRFKRVVARYGPAYPRSRSRRWPRAPAPGHAAPRRRVDRGRGQPCPPGRRPRRRVQRLEVPPHGARVISRFKNTRLRDRQRANDDWPGPRRHAGTRPAVVVPLSLDLIHQLVQLLPRQYKRCAIRRRVRHARLRLRPNAL